MTSHIRKAVQGEKPRTCERCGKKHLDEFVFLELNNKTNRFAVPGSIPDGDSQGLFPFGKQCAYQALAHTLMTNAEINRALRTS